MTALVCDLFYRHAAARTTRVIVERSNGKLERRKDRYAHPAIGGKFPDIQNALAKLGLITIKLGRRPLNGKRGAQTTISAAPCLLAMLPDATPDDFCQDSAEEVIVLRGVKPPGKKVGEEIDYNDTEVTAQMRAELVHVNTLLACADISIDAAALERHDGQTVDPAQRRCRRIFTDGSFDSYGRLHGGFWLEMSGAARHAALRIGGEGVVTLDYGQMAARLAYASVGVTPPPGDLYQTAGLATWMREGAKALLNAALASRRPLFAKPRDTAPLLPAQPLHELMSTLRAAHAPIAQLFGTGAGMRLVRVESDIMMIVLTQLMERGVVALPVHDGIVVAASHADQAELVMRSVFLTKTGANAVVSRVGGEVSSASGCKSLLLEVA